MANEAPIGDLVRLEDDERLDIPDARRLQSFTYEAVADALGALFGECSGVLSVPVFGETVGAVTIGECMLAGFKRRPGSNTRVRGGLFHYNPASPYQAGNTTLNLSAYQSPEAFPYLWFCRRELEADVETRVRHIGGVESTYAPKTTRRQYIGFGATTDLNTPPNETEDWFVFARVVSWSGVNPNKVPTIQPISVFDRGHRLGAVNAASLSDLIGRYSLLTGFLDSSGGIETGIAKVIGLLANFILRLDSNTHDFNANTLVVQPGSTAKFVPSDSAVRGRKELHADLETVEDIIAATPRMLVWGSVPANGALTGPNFTGLNKLQAAGSNDSYVTGAYTIKVKAASKPVCVQATTNENTVGGTALSRNPHAFVSATADPTVWNVVIFTWDAAGAEANNAFYVTVWGEPVP